MHVTTSGLSGALAKDLPSHFWTCPSCGAMCEGYGSCYNCGWDGMPEQ